MTNVTRSQGEVNQFAEDADFAKSRPFYNRIRLDWTAGQRGKPAVNADILSATEAVRMIADPDFEVIGQGVMTSALVTRGAEGGITMTTDTTDGDSSILGPHLDSNQSPWSSITWGTDKEVEWTARFQTGASVANIVIWAGLKLSTGQSDSGAGATDANQVFFRVEDDAGLTSNQWEGWSSIAGTATTIDTGMALAVNTDYLVHIKIDSGRRARMSITDGAGNHWTYRTAELTDEIDLKPYIAVQLDGASVGKALTVFGQSISRIEG